MKFLFWPINLNLPNFWPTWFTSMSQNFLWTNFQSSIFSSLLTISEVFYSNCARPHGFLDPSKSQRLFCSKNFLFKGPRAGSNVVQMSWYILKFLLGPISFVLDPAIVEIRQKNFDHSAQDARSWNDQKIFFLLSRNKPGLNFRIFKT
jgi:hypothetical protein